MTLYGALTNIGHFISFLSQLVILTLSSNIILYTVVCISVPEGLRKE